MIGVDSNLIILTVTAGAILLYTICDIVLYLSVDNISNGESGQAALGKTRTLVFGILLYLAAVVPFFIHRFEV